MQTSNGAIQKTNGSAINIRAFSQEQVDLIRRTVAPDATGDELAMFLHVANVSGLDPLRRQIHFQKRNGRVVFIADINGLQARAAREPDYRGLPHGIVYEGEKFAVINGQEVHHESTPFASKGQPVGAWAIVERAGMRPFLAVVKFSEYFAPSNPIWKEKPGVMILKCAKSTALRLAYPEQLGGIYERAEMDRADEEAAPAQRPPSRVEEVKALLTEKTGWVEPPPPSDSDAPVDVEAEPIPEVVPTFEPPQEVACVPFGKKKGTPVTALDGRGLAWYADAARKELADPSKSKFHGKTREWLAALEAEQAKRGAK